MLDAIFYEETTALPSEASSKGAHNFLHLATYQLKGLLRGALDRGSSRNVPRIVDGSLTLIVTVMEGDLEWQKLAAP